MQQRTVEELVAAINKIVAELAKNREAEKPDPKPNDEKPKAA